MKTLVATLACVAVLAAFGIVIVRVTVAEAPTAPLSSNVMQPLVPSGASATPAACGVDYVYTVSPNSGDEVTTTHANLLAAARCDGCLVPVSLPFPFTFYEQTYTTVGISDRGTLQFTMGNTYYHTCPFPFPQLGPSILPYWSEFLLFWGGSGEGPCVQNYGL